MKTYIFFAYLSLAYGRNIPRDSDSIYFRTDFFEPSFVSRSNGNSPKPKYFEYTDDGIIIKGGEDLPPGFKGSGNRDFAFDGESFRPYSESNSNINTNNISPNYSPDTNEINNVSTDSPNPNACEFKCHQSVTSEYNPVCGSNGVTYFNPGKFKCAVRCGRRITGRYYITCGQGSMTI